MDEVSDLKGFIIVLITCCCHKKLTQFWFLNTKISYNSVGHESNLALVMLQSRDWQDCVPFRRLFFLASPSSGSPSHFLAYDLFFSPSKKPASSIPLCLSFVVMSPCGWVPPWTDSLLLKIHKIKLSLPGLSRIISPSQAPNYMWRVCQPW